jgi:hypothetical protein
LSKVSAGKKEKHLALKKKIPIKETSWFYFLPYAMVAKETSEVITKTTKPKVIIQTKKLSEETNLSEQS